MTSTYATPPIEITVRDVPPRAQWALEQAGVATLLAKLYAARGITSRDELDDSLTKLLPLKDFLGIDKAATLIADAITKDICICIVADYDCDGATACAVGVTGLRMLGARQINYVVPNRSIDGYGLTPAISQRVAMTGAKLLITVDNGIASIEGVERAKSLGLTVIVTDHHLPGAQLPAADAIVNPNQPDCKFPSKSLAGVGVMFYVLLAVRALQRSRGLYETLTQPKLNTLLPLVALGTVADVVRLDSNNRRLVSQGLRRIRKNQMPEGMKALFHVAGRRAKNATTSDFAFTLAPRINAAGRLTDMRIGIECLLTHDAQLAKELAEKLNAINHERRSIEAEMREQALQLMESSTIELKAIHDIPNGGVETHQINPGAITIFDESFHEGVVGIVASRLKDQWHRPTFVFARSQMTNDNGNTFPVLKGSGRSIHGFHLRDALDLIAKRHNNLLLRFGGHAMAAGCTIGASDIKKFELVFNAIAQELLDSTTLQRTLLTDGSLSVNDCRVDVVESLNREVWGQGWSAPIFYDSVEIANQRIVGGKHLALKVKHQGSVLDAIFFGRTEPLLPKVALAYRLEINEWQGHQQVQWLIEAAKEE